MSTRGHRTKGTGAALVTASAVASCVLLAPRQARAENPAFEMAGKVGFVTSLNTLALGGRVGYSYRGFYGGLSLVDYLPLGNLGANTVVAEAEVGYGFTFSWLTLRPLLGFGYGFPDGCTFIHNAADPELGATCSPSGAFVLQPGGVVQLTFGHILFGIAPSALIPFVSGDHAMLEVDGQVGVRF
jgi:hypothetical protein